MREAEKEMKNGEGEKKRKKNDEGFCAFVAVASPSSPSLADASVADSASSAVAAAAASSSPSPFPFSSPSHFPLSLSFSSGWFGTISKKIKQPTVRLRSVCVHACQILRSLSSPPRIVSLFFSVSFGLTLSCYRHQYFEHSFT